MDRILRVGVIGVGTMGRHHARIYAELPDVELVGVADLSETTASLVAEKCHTKAFRDYRELLNEGLDAVSIAVPTSLHRQIAVNVADAKVNMLLEKPIADSVENAEEIIGTATKNGVRLMIGHIERFNPIIPIIKKSIENAAVILIHITRVGPLPPRIKDVGVIVDLAVHDIDLIRYLSNSGFKRIYSLTSSNLSQYEDTAIVSFEMQNGTLAQITTDWLTPFKVREISIATKEKFVKGWFIEQKVTEYSRYKEDGSYLVKELSVPYGEPLKLELDAFIDSLKNNEEPAVTACDGLEALEIALKCVEAK